MADLFISYAREDRECAELLSRALTARGWTVWWDREIGVGASFSEVIERELGKAKCVLVLWSQHSLASDWVQNEAAEALHRKALVPVRIEDVRPPLEFRRLQTADLLDWRRGFHSPDFQRCITAIELLVGQTTPKPIPLPTPPGPQPPPRPNPQPYSPAQTIPNYLVPAILVTALCCLPLGIVAVVYATQVNAKLAAGDYAGAKRASDSAKLWTWISAGLGVVTFGFFVVIGVMGNLAQY